MYCPYCQNTHIVKNGSNGVGTPKFLCKTCRKQFVENPKNKRVSGQTKQTIDKLLLERISLAGIARATNVSECYLQKYINRKYATIEKRVKVFAQDITNLVIECDELWSFVGKRNKKQWVWLAFDRQTSAIVGVYIGKRGKKGAKGLWCSIPEIYRNNAVFYTDFWKAYCSVIPKKRHHAVGKETGKTNHIERFNCTLRQRVSRLVRKSLSFSKKLENHIGAIWYFIHHHNEMVYNRLAEI